MRSAALFQLVTMPSRSLPTMASSEDSTMAANRSAASSIALFSATLMIKLRWIWSHAKSGRPHQRFLEHFQESIRMQRLRKQLEAVSHAGERSARLFGKLRRRGLSGEQQQPALGQDLFHSQ